jgi:FkbM family methyltransferase
MACGNHPYYDKLATIGWSGFQWETAASKWESRTQKIFAHLITEETTYLGFGEWIGPTILFAAKRSKALYAMEPDPAAFDSLCKNIQANRALGYDQKIHVERRCVSTKREDIEMKGIGGGGSALQVDDLAKHTERQARAKIPPVPTFTAPCDTLDAFLTEHNLLHEPRLFIKIDTEGAEKFILPTIIEPLLTTKLRRNMPTVYISFHGQFSNMVDDPVTQQAVLKLVSHFQHAVYYSDREAQQGERFVAGKDVTVDMVTRSGDLILTNLDLSSSFAECPT